MKIYLASDHAGFAMKEALKSWLTVRGDDVVDCGAVQFEASDDYPDFISVAARKLSSDVSASIDSRAIVLGGSGQGEAIVANRFLRRSSVPNEACCARGWKFSRGSVWSI